MTIKTKEKPKPKARRTVIVRMYPVDHKRHKMTSTLIGATDWPDYFSRI